jgi:hypothetical protein
MPSIDNWPSRVACDGAGSPSTVEPRTCETVRAASGRPCRLGRKPGERPAGPQQGQPHPEWSAEGSQCGSLPFSLEGNELNGESGVLHRDGDMAAQEESHETKQGQDEDRHEPRFLVSPALKVKSLPADRLLASHRVGSIIVTRLPAARRLNGILSSYQQRPSLLRQAPSPTPHGDVPCALRFGYLQ